METLLLEIENFAARRRVDKKLYIASSKKWSLYNIVLQDIFSLEAGVIGTW